MRGSLQVYNIANGKLVWRTYTVPGLWRSTWKGDSWKLGGGTVWNAGSYDPATNTMLWGTSNPSPWDAAARSTGTSNYGNLTNGGTASTVALDPDNGRLKWEIQSTPADAWDYDGIVTPVLTTLQINGRETPVYLKDDRNGFFFVANLETGKLISAEPFAPENWAKSFDILRDRPIEDPAKRPRIGFKAVDICPAAMGATNWQSMSFNPQTGLAYIPVNNMCMDMQAKQVVYHRGMFYLGNDFSFHPGKGGWLGQLLAYNPVTQKPVWKVDRPLPWNGGTMTTAGNLVFQGDIEGVFHAYDAQNGNELWHVRLGSGMIAAPVTFVADGKQYVAILGWAAASDAIVHGDGRRANHRRNAAGWHVVRVWPRLAAAAGHGHEGLGNDAYGGGVALVVMAGPAGGHYARSPERRRRWLRTGARRGVGSGHRTSGWTAGAAGGGQDIGSCRRSRDLQ